MHFEYMALAVRDIDHPAVKRMFTRLGWEEYVQAPWYGGDADTSDVYIMRRPKDEPQDRTGGFQYLLLDDQTSPDSKERMAAKCHELLSYGWEEWRTIAWSGIRVGGVRVFRRNKERHLVPKDEPRKWMEKEIERIARGTKGSVLNERAMQADHCGRLERRNVELQAAIDAVVDIARSPDEQDCYFLGEIRAIKQLLYPLATTKQETNG